ncbi:hypothetical protein GL218_04934 [Daldinia childiae]|uniref:uncharacterized protein n=1 Tax=Daldinia childiae TaxID=326645 RepID=UPI001445D7B6|nr:uncharacterized protein GL218_04934 [Daldinia childiae]KAF3059410.1 hypothetical protein GL218_04934 [Daldinia childiae]
MATFILDWKPSDPLGPDKRVPLLSGRRLEMFKALEDHDNYYELSLMFPALANDMENFGSKLPASREASLQIHQDHVNQRPMGILLHAIPKDMLRSLILGTVAFDQLKLTKASALRRRSRRVCHRDGHRTTTWDMARP